jgi:MFS family permease
LNDAQLGSSLFALPLGLMFTLPFTSYLLGKYSSRGIMLIGSMAYSILLCILGYVTQTWQFVGVLFLFGAARNLMNIPVNAQSVGVQGLYPKSIITSFHGVWSLSGFAAAAVGGWMISHSIAPNIHFIVVGIITISTMLFFYKNTFRNDAPKPNAQPKRITISFPDKPLIKLGLIAFACMSCEGIMFDWSGIYFKKIVVAPKSLEALGYIAFMCAAATGRFIGDWLVNKYGLKTMVQIFGCLIAGGLLLSISLPYLIPATIGFILTGLGVSCIVPLTMSLAGKSSSTKTPGQAIASVSTVSYFGFLLGPPIIGYIAEAANLRWSFSLGVLAGLGITFLISKIKIA